MQGLTRRVALIFERHLRLAHLRGPSECLLPPLRTFTTLPLHLEQHGRKPRTQARTKISGHDLPSSGSESTGDKYDRSNGLSATRAKEDKPVVRWFNQLTPWSKDRRISDPDNPDADDDTGEVKWLKQEIDRLDGELREMSGEGDDDKTLIEHSLAELPPEHQKGARAYIKKLESLKAENTKKIEQQVRQLEIKWTLAPQQDAYLRHLNAYIRKATIWGLEKYTLRRRVWLSYARCKAFLPPFLHLIPHDTWGILLSCQAVASVSDDPHWATHVIQLVEDMRDTGVQVDPRQNALYIEALRFEGRLHDAISEWRLLGQSVQKDDREAAEYELLGVRLFTSQGDLGKAEEIASKYLETGDKSESRILIPIIDTWIGRKDEIGMKHAWALYLRLRTQLGADITMDDYDNVSLSFLKVNRTDLALAVFKDMMLTGKQSGYDSLELSKISLGLVGKLHQAASDTPEVNKISLTAMTSMPRSYQNKFFYGSWMKKLIGMGETDSAASVLELMYERGVTPSPKHLNGIIGAWLRTTSDHQKKKAEQMAWGMIHQRLDFVRRRSKEPALTGPTSSNLHDQDLSAPAHERRAIPRATMETYCILLLYYSRRGRWGDLQVLQNALESGQMQPNSYWINHLLFARLRRGRHDLVWAGYSDMFSDVVTPDLETFECLWGCERAHLDPHNRSKTHQKTCRFPTPRRLMREMISWLQTYDKGNVAGGHPSIAADISRELCEEIVRCTAQAGDWPGTLVALYVLRDHFGFYPDKSTTHFVGLLFARSITISPKELPSKPKNHTTQVHQIKMTKQARVDKILQLVHDERAAKLAEAGYDDFEELDEFIRREERLFVLAQFLRMVLRRTAPAGRDITGDIAQAASEMGVPGLNMDDPLPYNR